MSENFEGYFAARHTIKPKQEDPESAEYKGASEKGVELGKERAKEVLEFLRGAKEGTVMFISGASELPRTKTMDNILGDELKRIAAEEDLDEIIVLTPEDILPEENEKKGYSEIVKDLTAQIEKNPDKKFVIELPLFLKEFAGQGRWMDKDGKDTEYTTALLTKHDGNNEACLREWIETEGKMGYLQGPNPTQVAEEHLAGIKRLEEFAHKNLPSRPLIIGSAGHSWNLDALAVYLANEGKVDVEGFEKVGGEMIKETELIRVEIEDKGSKLVYKGQEFSIDNQE